MKKYLKTNWTKHDRVSFILLYNKRVGEEEK